MSTNQKLNPMLNMMIRKAAPTAFKEQEYPASFCRTLEIILKDGKVDVVKKEAK